MPTTVAFLNVAHLVKGVVVATKFIWFCQVKIWSGPPWTMDNGDVGIAPPRGIVLYDILALPLLVRGC